MPPKRPSAAVTGIVLAGGRASRFGRDKLAEPVDGRPLLHHALRALGRVVGDILLVIPPVGDPPSLPQGGVGPAPIRLVRDPEPFGGPLVAVAAALDATTSPRVLLVGGDMPELQSQVLSALVAALDEHDADVVLLEGPGPVQSMPAAIRADAARLAAHAALDDGARALRALYDRVRVHTLAIAEWTSLDPDRQTLRDVDTPADLTG